MRKIVKDFPIAMDRLTRTGTKEDNLQFVPLIVIDILGFRGFCDLFNRYIEALAIA